MLRRPSFSLLLLPPAWLYDAVTRLRNALFDRGILRSRRFAVPSVAVGNLAVGGTGKTPHAEYLLSLLSKTWRTALLSRGYGRSTKGFRIADADSVAAEVGDEPRQMAGKFPGVTVAVDEDRCDGFTRLLSLEKPPEVVVLDDAYQHRYVRAGLYILLTDHSRLYTDDLLLPAGRLRESRRGARRADVVIVTKCPPDVSEEELNRIRRRLRLAPHRHLFFTTVVYKGLQRLFDTEEGPSSTPEELLQQETFEGRPLLVVTGIARPEPLYGYVRKALHAVPVALRFPDHHAFTRRDVGAIASAFAESRAAGILTTEKDAVRLRPFADCMPEAMRRRLCVVPIGIKFLNHEDTKFNQIITDYVRSHQTNG